MIQRNRFIQVRSFIVLSVVWIMMSPTRLSADGFTYRWGHPVPQGNMIYGLAFSGASTAFAVTGCGQILKSIDAGENWSIFVETDSVCNDFYDILVSAEGTLIVSGNHGRIMRSTDQGETWQTQEYPDGGALYDLALIPGGGISAAGANGTVLVSFNDGISWSDTGPGGNGQARHHFWKSGLEAYVVGSGMFFRTTDGGVSWQQIDTPPAFGLNEVYFVNQDTGYAVEDFGYWKTMDGGENWEHVTEFSGIVYRFRTVVLDDQHWFSVTLTEGGELWETLDAGLNWDRKPLVSYAGFACLVKHGNRLLFGSENGDLFYTDNGGTDITNTTTNLAVFPSAPVSIIGSRPDGTLFANNQPNSGTNNGTFFRSNTGGNSWFVPEPSPGLRWVLDIQFADNQHGVLGAYEDVRYTLDGGDTWNSSSFPAGYRLVNFALPSADRYFAATYTLGGGGNVYRSADQGASWQAVGGGLPLNSLYATCIAFSGSDTGYVALQSGNQPAIYRTTDGGDTWNLQPQTGLGGFIADMIWFDGNTGLAALPNNGSGIYRTSDGGLSWEQVSASGARTFTRSDNGRVATVYPGDDFFRESTDMGLSWLPFSPPFSSRVQGYSGSVESIALTSAGYVIGGDGNRLLVADRQIPASVSFFDDGNQSQPESEGIRVIPNPVSDQAVISVQLEQSRYATIRLIDAKGLTVRKLLSRTLQAGATKIELNLNAIQPRPAPGVYFVVMTTADESRTTKLVVSD